MRTMTTNPNGVAQPRNMYTSASSITTGNPDGVCVTPHTIPGVARRAINRHAHSGIVRRSGFRDRSKNKNSRLAAGIFKFNIGLTYILWNVRTTGASILLCRMYEIVVEVEIETSPSDAYIGPKLVACAGITSMSPDVCAK